MGKLLRRLGRLKQPDKHDIQAATLATLRALRDSAGFFPPLKSATGCVLHIAELCETVKTNRDGCRALARRAEDILFRINDVVPDITAIPPDLRDRISDFARSLEPIQKYMETLQSKSFGNKMRRILRHKEDQDKITEFNQTLDRALQSFQLISSIKVEETVRNLEKDLKFRLSLLSADLKLGRNDDKMIDQQMLLLILFF